MEHHMRIEKRPAKCCSVHSHQWVVCSCGHEKDTASSSVQGAITAHRLAILEEATGVRVVFQ